MHDSAITSRLKAAGKGKVQLGDLARWNRARERENDEPVRGGPLGSAVTFN